METSHDTYIYSFHKYLKYKWYGIHNNTCTDRRRTKHDQNSSFDLSPQVSLKRKSMLISKCILQTPVVFH